MASPGLEQTAEQALVAYLHQCPDHTADLPKAGMVVKRTGFLHGIGLKRWIQSKSHLFEVFPLSLSMCRCTIP